MTELTRGNYFSTKEENYHRADGRLEVWRGFSVTVSVYNKQLYLQVDPVSRVLRD